MHARTFRGGGSETADLDDLLGISEGEGERECDSEIESEIEIGSSGEESVG